MHECYETSSKVFKYQQKSNNVFGIPGVDRDSAMTTSENLTHCLPRVRLKTRERGMSENLITQFFLAFQLGFQKTIEKEQI